MIHFKLYSCLKLLEPITYHFCLCLPVGLMAAVSGCDHAEYQCLSSAFAVVPAIPTPGYSMNGLRPDAAAANAPK